MRAWTLGVSVVFHLCVIAGIIATPLLATGELPPIPRAAPEYVLVTASLPKVPPQRPSVKRTESSTAAPITAPDRVVPEAPVPTPPGPTDFDVIGGDPDAGPFVPGGAGAGGDTLPQPPIPPTPPAPKQVYQVGGNIRPPQKIRDVAPRYPAMAQASRVEGIVILEALISEDGSVQNVRVLRGKPLLDDAATDAVRQWRFTPPLLNGQPVPVVMTVTVSFSLK
jgi:periplasmic protein TonB